jgi:dTDP-4-dehydrorhamnose reductase
MAVPVDRLCLVHAAQERADRLFAGADLLIHAAANTNVEQCETDPQTCYRDNFLLTELVARAAAIAGIKLVYVSSTGVYGAYQDEPYTEYSEARPPTHHHRAKQLGEQAVLALSASNIVVRTSWLFGGRTENPKNFIARRLEEAHKALANGACLYSNSEQRGVPTFTLDVAQRVLALVESGHTGLFNCVNQGHASRQEYVQAIIETAGIPVPVLPTSAASFNRKAQVSNNEMALNWKMDCLGFPAMPHWRESLGVYMRNNSMMA